jgi:polyribonucleotide nucleotidyltransferase
VVFLKSKKEHQVKALLMDEKQKRFLLKYNLSSYKYKG